MLVFTGFGLLCGVAGAAVLWWFASQPFDFYTAGYQPLDFASVRIDSPSAYGYMAAGLRSEHWAVHSFTGPGGFSPGVHRGSGCRRPLAHGYSHTSRISSPPLSRTVRYCGPMLTIRRKNDSAC